LWLKSQDVDPKILPMKCVLLVLLASPVVAKEWDFSQPPPVVHSKGYVRMPHTAVPDVVEITDEDLKAAPSSIDWSKKGAVTPVKDQGMCGSCWAYSATEGIESSIFMATGKLPAPLAAQQIISCDHTKAAGCSGGDLPTALNYVESAGGIDTATDYPATSANDGKNGTCSWDKKTAAKVTGFKYALPPCQSGNCAGQDENVLAAALAKYGPISVCVNAGDGHWDFYEAGMVWPPAAHPCSGAASEIDHCVQLVGYDKTASTPYWKIRNSWGDIWGEEGYIRLQMGVNACGIADEAVIVLAEASSAEVVV